MMVPTSVILCGLAVTLFLLHKYILAPAWSPLSAIHAANPLCIFSDHWMKWHYKKGTPFTAIHQAHRKFGPLVRVGPTEVSIASAQGLRAVYTAGLDRHSWYAFFRNYDTPNLVSMEDGKSHSIQKRMISAVYAKSYLLHSPDLRRISAVVMGQRFRSLLKTLSESGSESNVVLVAQWVGMDMMTAYLFGLQHGTDWLRNREEAKKYLEEFETKRDDFGQPKYAEDTCMSMCKKALAAIEGGTEAGPTRPVVFERLYTPLYKLLKHEQRTEDEIMKRVASEMLDQMLASHETTSITLTYAIWHLSKDAEMQRRLRDEISSLKPPIGDAQHEGEDVRLPSPSAIDSLPLLNQVLTETLRLHAAAPGPQARVVPPGGLTVHGRFLPAGTTISANAYTLHRDEELFPNAESWRPQRWEGKLDGTAMSDEIDKTDEPSKSMRRFFWAFGSGGRMCIGSNFALQMLKLALVMIYSSYTTTIVDDEGIEQEQTVIARPKGNKLIVKFETVED